MLYCDDGHHRSRPFTSSDVSKIRKMAFAGLAAKDIVSELKLDIAPNTLRNRCKALSIKLRARGRPRKE